MSRALKATAIRLTSASALAVTVLTAVGAAPASASPLTDGISATARAENGNGACAHGGYVGGPNQSSSCYGGTTTAHAWCADFMRLGLGPQRGHRSVHPGRQSGQLHGLRQEVRDDLQHAARR